MIVFDLDETLGSFGDLYLLWTGVKHLHPEFNQFKKLIDLISRISNFKEFQKFKKIKPKNVKDIDRLRDYVSSKMNSLGI